MENRGKHLVFVVGAGPAGLFAARELALNGVDVVLLNRDIKPGGLAEYGIYPDKHKMKDGLRNQFRAIIDTPNVHYYGNVLVGKEGDLTLQDLNDLGAQAILVTAGAQGTKWLGLPGEHLKGVYHAKDLVYHYNLLPPFSAMEYLIGRRAALVGVGNVMMDICRWLITEKQVKEIVAVARRGPAEVKFDRKELENVVAYLDRDDLAQELKRVEPVMLGIGQELNTLPDLIESAMHNATPAENDSRLRMRFLASPVAMIGDDNGRVCALEVEDNTLVRANGDVKARGLGSRHILDVDTVIFAIGDNVDEKLGLNVMSGSYIHNEDRDILVDGEPPECLDSDYYYGDNIFLAGWSRQASTGLVGVARKDGTNGARSVLCFLESQPTLDLIPVDAIKYRLHSLGHPVITKDELNLLMALEQKRAQELGVPSFKYATNQEMLRAIGL